MWQWTSLIICVFRKYKWYKYKMIPSNKSFHYNAASLTKIQTHCIC